MKNLVYYGHLYFYMRVRHLVAPFSIPLREKNGGTGPASLSVNDGDSSTAVVLDPS
jgi:hypothetical protein